MAASACLTFGGWQATSGHFTAGSVHAARVYTNYRVRSANYRELRVVKHDATLWQRPYNPGVRAVGSTRNLAGTNKVVHLNQEAYAHGKVKYYQIGRLNRKLGWVNANDLRVPRQVILPYRYVSQFWPSHADDACEAAALMMAVSVKGKGDHVPLRTIVKKIPRNSDPNKGYTHNPFKLGTGATIYPKGLTKLTKRFFNLRSKNITGASKRSLISDIKHGNPVVYEGSYLMNNTSSDHSLVLLGYAPGYFYYADPYSKTFGLEHAGWVSTNQFMHIFTAKKRGARALLID